MEIKGHLPRKDNNRFIARNPRTGTAFIPKSKPAQQYVKDFIAQVPKGAVLGLDEDLALVAVVYYRSRRSDLSVELLKDCIERAGIIKNDRSIRLEVLLGLVDKEDPRVLFSLLPWAPLADGIMRLALPGLVPAGVLRFAGASSRTTRKAASR